MKTAAVHPALLPFLCGSLVDARPQAAAGLFEQFSAIGVWATRPHFLQRSVGDPPTFILRPAHISAKECGRPAHIYPVYPPHSSCDPPTFILCTRPHSSCVPAHIHPVYPPTFILCTCKGGRVALPPLATYQQRCFLKRCLVKTADALREADEKRGSGTT